MAEHREESKTFLPFAALRPRGPAALRQGSGTEQCAPVETSRVRWEHQRSANSDAVNQCGRHCCDPLIWIENSLPFRENHRTCWLKYKATDPIVTFGKRFRMTLSHPGPLGYSTEVVPNWQWSASSRGARGRPVELQTPGEVAGQRTSSQPLMLPVKIKLIFRLQRDPISSFTATPSHTASSELLNSLVKSWPISLPVSALLA